MDNLGFHSHDHTHCMSDAIAKAEAQCREKGLQFTPVRKRTLEILLEEHKAIGAYDLLARLSEEGFGSQPPVAYRALEFLTKNGFVHKIERLNAFIACAHPSTGHTPAFLICTECDVVGEAAMPPVNEFWATVTKETGFTISKAVLEAEGRCEKCQEASS